MPLILHTHLVLVVSGVSPIVKSKVYKLNTNAAPIAMAR